MSDSLLVVLLAWSRRRQTILSFVPSVPLFRTVLVTRVIRAVERTQSANGWPFHRWKQLRVPMATTATFCTSRNPFVSVHSLGNETPQLLYDFTASRKGQMSRCLTLALTSPEPMPCTAEMQRLRVVSS